MREALSYWGQYISLFFGFIGFCSLLYSTFFTRKKLREYRKAILESNRLQSEKLDILILKQYQILQELEKQRKIHL
jgi:hypothetical protein